MDERTDIELVDRARRGDSRAWQTLVERHYPMVYRLAFRWCGAEHDAEDIAQEVCVKIVRKLRTFRGRSSYRTWLYRVTVNTARDYLRQRSLREPYHSPLPEGTPGNNPASSPRDMVAASWIESALDRLPVPQKEAVFLVLGEGMSHGEAAEVLGCMEATVSWRVFQARRTLRNLLGQEK
jgi:RNA polymerase sigma-70 factor (ECF subfamily)